MVHGQAFRPIISGTAPVQGAYTAPDNGTNNLTLGEMYLRQRLFNNSLVIAAGRLATGSTFAIMPVLYPYVNAAIDPGLFGLGINDATFAFSPPARNGALKRFTRSPRGLRWRLACSTPT